MEFNDALGPPEAKKPCKGILETSSSFHKHSESQTFDTKHHDPYMLSESTDFTVILDLSNNLLEKVFKHLKLIDLCAVAEVCCRFEQIAKTWFGNSQKTDLNFMDDIKSDSEGKILFKTSKILHHLGAHFTKFDGTDFSDENNGSYWMTKEKQEEQHRIFELLIQHCSGTLTEIKFFGINVTDEWLPSMKPLLEWLQVLEVQWLETCQAFIDIFPLWLTELRELKLRLNIRINPKAFHSDVPPDELCQGQVLHFDSWKQPLKKLEKISLRNATYLTSHDIEEILKHNPQLKKIELERCQKLDCKIFDSIVNHVPDIEYLHIEDVLFQKREAQHFGQFRNLRSMKLHFYPPLKSKYLVILIDQLTEANIILESLELSNIDFRGKRSSKRLEAKRFVDGVSKLKSLHTLKLGIPHLSTPHHYVICTNLPALRELALDTYYPLTPALISGIIRSAHKLKWLHLISDRSDCERPIVDSANFNEWMNIVASRSDKTPLEMWLSAESYTTSHTVPVRVSKGTFTLLIAERLTSIRINHEDMRKRPNTTSGIVSDF